MDRIGELIGDGAARAAWRETVLSLHEAARPGGPLEGYLFHGTSLERARAILEEGMEETFCITQDARGGPWYETTGTHWGVPKVAAFYAEDLIESLEDPALPLALLAVQRDTLEACGGLRADGQTLDCPLHTRLERGEDEILALWDASPQGWEDCLELYGTLLVLGAVGPGETFLVASPEDLEALISGASGPRP